VSESKQHIQQTSKQDSLPLTSSRLH